MGQPADPVFHPTRMGDVPHSYASVESAHAALGYRPTVAFAEGLRRTVEGMRGGLIGATRG
jgi:nucleoside-diphosphate-sugar epimerase